MEAMESVRNPEVEKLKRRLREVSEERDALNTENANLWADIGALGSERDMLRAENAKLRHLLDQMTMEFKTLVYVARQSAASVEILPGCEDISHCLTRHVTGEYRHDA